MSSISSISSGLSQAQLAQQVSIKVAVKTLDAARAQGDAAIALLQAASHIADPDHDGDVDGHGPDVDSKVGRLLDVTA